MIAITRDVSRSISRCELSFLAREPIDYARAVEQHDAYCRALANLGLEVVRLPADEDFPDCCFVEDVAVVLDELAVVTRPGAASRRGETAAVADALARWRPLCRIAEPAMLDGGDVLAVGRRLFVGLGARTNRAGLDALAGFVTSVGYSVVPVSVTGCLHLKSAVSALNDETLLIHTPFLDAAPFEGLRLVQVPAREPAAANVLSVRGRVLVHAGFAGTLELLAREGCRVIPLDVSEFLKAEAGLTCKSLLLNAAAAADSACP